MAISRHMHILPDPEEKPLMDIAIKDLKTVNQHFGSAQTFALYGVNPERSELLEVAEFGQLEQDGQRGQARRLDRLAGGLRGGVVLPGHRRLRRPPARGPEHPAGESPDGSAIAELVSGPSAWLAKGPDVERFAKAEFENWEE